MSHPPPPNELPPPPNFAQKLEKKLPPPGGEFIVEKTNSRSPVFFEFPAGGPIHQETQVILTPPFHQPISHNAACVPTPGLLRPNTHAVTFGRATIVYQRHCHTLTAVAVVVVLSSHLLPVYPGRQQMEFCGLHLRGVSPRSLREEGGIFKKATTTLLL